MDARSSLTPARLQSSQIDAPCATSPWDLGGVRRFDVSGYYHTVSDGTPVQIRPNGSFFLSSATDHGDPLWPGADAPTSLRLRGRFADSGHLATGSFRVSRSPAGLPPCVKRGTFRARFTGQRHLTVGACPPPHATSLAGDGVVYEEDYVYDPVIRHSDIASDLGGVIYGCDRATGRRWFLAGDDTNDALVNYYNCAEKGVGNLPAGFPGSRVASAGELVALGLYELCVSGFGSEVRIVDLQTGMVQLDRPAPAQPFASGGPNSNIRSVALAPGGSAAWIVCDDFSTTPDCQVVDEVAYGPNQLLDLSHQVDPDSLNLNGSSLSWRNNGETKTATLG
jgi:hypothetical protein